MRVKNANLTQKCKPLPSSPRNLRAVDGASLLSGHQRSKNASFRPPLQHTRHSRGRLFSSSSLADSRFSTLGTQLILVANVKCALCTLWGGRPVRGSGRPAASGRLPGSQHVERETQSTVAKTILVYFTRKVRVEGSRNYQ